MTKVFQKIQPLILLSDFLERVKKVKEFRSSTGRRYQVTGNRNDDLLFQRLDAKEQEEWKMNLKMVYKAYVELDNFETVNFKPYVPRKHSPARGLLLHLKMLQ